MSDVLRVSELSVKVPTRRYVDVSIDKSLVGKMADSDEMRSIMSIASLVYFCGSKPPSDFGEKVQMASTDVLVEVFRKLVERFYNSRFNFRSVGISDIFDNIDEAPKFWMDAVVPHMLDFYEEGSSTFGFPRNRDDYQLGDDIRDFVTIFETFMLGLEVSVVCEYYPTT